MAQATPKSEHPAAANSAGPFPLPQTDAVEVRAESFRESFGSGSRGSSTGLPLLVFVTQLPQQVPRQVFGLVNSYVLHKITDPQMVSTLRHTVSGSDPGLWSRLPGLAPGQASVSFPHMARPLLVAVDPTPAKLRLVE